MFGTHGFKIALEAVRCCVFTNRPDCFSVQLICIQYNNANPKALSFSAGEGKLTKHVDGLEAPKGLSKDKLWGTVCSEEGVQRAQGHGCCGG